MDVHLFEKIVVCDAEALSTQDQALSNDNLHTMERDDMRALCKRCKYKQLKNTGELQTKTISISGADVDVKGRALAYFQVLRQQKSLGIDGERQFTLNANQWTPAEDARLLEALMDPSYERVISAAFVPSNRQVLDVSDGSPKVAVWKNVIAVLFNNFIKYRPEHRFSGPNEELLRVCDPNSEDIPRRIPEHLRNRFATLRSRFTVVYSMWRESGGNDPERLMSYINVSSPLDITIYYMFRVLHNQGRDVFLHRCQRTVSEEYAVDSGSTGSVPMRDALARISGNQRSTTSTENPSGTRRTPMADLRSDLNRMWTEMDEERKEEEITHKALRLQSLMSARDIAANSMEKHENEALGAPPGSRKRKRHVQMYKYHKNEWINLMKQTSELQDLPFNESDYDDDPSVLGEDD
mmetsp:Transcript_10834/g.19645  ORF Transcript_10834/g.19645 Transcript_10834/m.19645 type:complete len:409 (+) Transcript_10834:178-1404(+)